MWFMTLYIVVGGSAWIFGLIHLDRIMSRLPDLRHYNVADNELPMLSIIIPACNEILHIESSLQSLLAQDYPSMELIVVDDRSNDGTGEIIDEFAARDSRIRPVHITQLPSDWLGKVHALNQGVQYARGEWLLFTDADVHFSAGCLRSAVAYAMHTKADLLSLLPGLIPRRFWLSVTVRAFGLLFLSTTRADLVDRPDNRHFIGIGAFNLVRRRAFEITAGFDWLKMEPGDDAALGMMIKQAGGRLRFAIAQEYLSLGWYPNIRAMFRGMEKNLFGAGAHYQWHRVLLQTVLAWLLVSVPTAGLFLGFSAGRPELALLALAVWLALFVFAGRHGQRNLREIASLILFPVGIILINFMMIHAAWRCLRNNGIEWRGTHYALDKLRAGQRIRF